MLQAFKEANFSGLQVFIIYTGKVLPAFADVYESCTAIIKKLKRMALAKN